MLGALATILLLLLIAGRGFVIALRAPDGFSRLLAGGLSAAIAIQTIIILGGVLRLIPLTGITLPFVPRWQRVADELRDRRHPAGGVIDRNADASRRWLAMTIWFDRLRLLAGVGAAIALIGYGLAVEKGISDARWPRCSVSGGRPR
ncbi:MAG: FtsW/RodA/SpoVE family cell cycle protein [Thermomicrobiales bacterium]